MQKGDVWLIDLSTGQGHEQQGQRPAVIIGKRFKDLVVVIPLTTSDDTAVFPYTQIIAPEKENGLSDDSVALVYQMRAVAKTRFERKMGMITETDMKAIDMLVVDLLGL